ncbi:glycosyltransferase family 2 protein [Winogradskyella luteola]|uniref:Glycosyltransferase family 2 protein n=1 Tax=Winogradskyella luteola TaxID=2828330 RepID=A0A9X1JN47_9FLAO|nr:glycosyltransferase family 2 protein [Winogradskyella luteola]MBV7269170.1 glycosyltransferase family 2 protein [Winogradskyella luteola]
MELSIIIVNYNGEKFLIDCIRSIKKKCLRLNYEIIIWDNTSTDNSVNLLNTHFTDDVKLFLSKENLGFAGGNNAAAKHAKGKYILLLNNDTKLLIDPSCAIELLSNEKIGIVSFKMLGTNREYRYSTGKFPNPLRLLKLSLLFEKRDGFKNGVFKNKEPLRVDWVEGSFLLTKKEIWENLGGLDEDFFMYAEDIDYCKRVSDLHYETYYIPVDGYIHHGGYGSDRQHMLFNSLNLYLDKHTNGLYKYLYKLALNINLLVKHVKRVIKKIT